MKNNRLNNFGEISDRLNHHLRRAVKMISSLTFTGLMLSGFTACTQPHTSAKNDSKKQVATAVTRKQAPVNGSILTGADQINLYVDDLRGKKVGMVINQTSVIGPEHTLSVDTLMALGINVKKIFGPEHGFRGNASAGAKVDNTLDAKSGLPIISLYGKHHKPDKEDLADLDVLIFDIQDVGARFYTYISTLHYVMEACAENNLQLLILDRPNPNGFYIDGPIMQPEFKSFVGMHAIPIVHGMTIGEYAQMINGEKWLEKGVQCKIKVIPIAHYTHKTPYVLPINPSPNLNTPQSVLLYPSTCLFEGTTLSLGRGTQYPFLMLGHPVLKNKYKFSFKPISIAGMSEDPPQKDKLCFGIDLRSYDTRKVYQQGKINLTWLIELYQNFPDKSKFFNDFFNKLAGTAELKQQIEAGKSEAEIRKTWQPGLKEFEIKRQKYLLYQ